MIAATELVCTSSIDAVSKAMGLKCGRLRDQDRARMARPEKAKERKMKPRPTCSSPWPERWHPEVGERGQGARRSRSSGHPQLPGVRQDHVPMQVRMRFAHAPD